MAGAYALYLGILPENEISATHLAGIGIFPTPLKKAISSHFQPQRSAENTKTSTIIEH